MPKSKNTVIYDPVCFRSTNFLGHKIPGDVILFTKAIVHPNQSVEISWWDENPINGEHYNVEKRVFKIGDTVFDHAGKRGKLVEIKAKIVVIETGGILKRHVIPAFVEKNRLHPPS